ncbi:ZIP family metal transporter [Candidatus Gottesmanbacteria bacterium]|nr:ZIP family metal transporter [Candidatus Gottesmanbacteria bacterium]
MSTLGLIITASLFVSLISFVGALGLIRTKGSSARHGTTLVAFAAGVMLASAVLALLPEALEEAGSSIAFPLFWGIVLFFFLERFLLWIHHHHEPHGVKPTAPLILVGDGMHNFIDGVAIAAAFLTSPLLGATTTLAIAAHEIPQEIADLSLLIYSGMKKRIALALNFVSGLTAMVGAIGGYFYLEHLRENLPLILAFTVGMFLYIACSDLIPEMHKDFAKQKRWQQTLPFIVGVCIMWIITLFLHE